MSGASATTTGEAEPRGRSRTRRSVKRPRLLKDFVTDISPERGISAGEHEPEEGVDNAEVAQNDLELSNDDDETKETPGDDNQGGRGVPKTLRGGGVMNPNQEPLSFGFGTPIGSFGAKNFGQGEKETGREATPPVETETNPPPSQPPADDLAPKLAEMESNWKEAKEPEVEGFVVETKVGNPLTHDDDDDDPNADPYRQCFKRVKKSQPNEEPKGSPSNVATSGRDENHNKGVTSPELKLQLSPSSDSLDNNSSSCSDVSGSQDADDGVDEDAIRWADQMRASLRCGPILNDLKNIFPNVPWSNPSNFSVKVVGPPGQQVQIITLLTAGDHTTDIYSPVQSTNDEAEHCLASPSAVSEPPKYHVFQDEAGNRYVIPESIPDGQALLTDQTPAADSMLYQTLDSLPSTSTGASTSFVNPAYPNKTAHENNVQKQSPDNTGVEANTTTGYILDFGSASDFLQYLSYDASGVAETQR